jgi:hypothetical protein
LSDLLISTDYWTLRRALPGLVAHFAKSPTLTSGAYGPDGLSCIPEILANNAGRIPNPGALRAGTELFMAPATVRAS